MTRDVTTLGGDTTIAVTETFAKQADKIDQPLARQLEKTIDNLDIVLGLLCPGRKITLQTFDSKFTDDTACRVQRNAMISKGKVDRNVEVSVGFRKGYSQGILELKPNTIVNSEIAKVIVEIGPESGILIVFTSGMETRRHANALRILFHPKEPIAYGVELVRVHEKHNMIPSITSVDLASDKNQVIEDVAKKFEKDNHIYATFVQVRALLEQFVV